MFLKAINAAALSTAFVLAMGASSLSVQADTAGDSYDMARCAEAQTTGNAFLKQQFCGTAEIQGMMTPNGGTARDALTLEQMNCASSSESNGIPCAVEGAS